MSVGRRRVAVVLFNLGGPDSPQAVRPFLYNLFRDPAIIALPFPFRQLVARLISTTREKSAQANYAIMGGFSLLRETQAQAAALEAAFAQGGAEVRAFLAMRYWKPFTHDAAREVEAYAPDEVVLLPLYPQFSTTTSASSLKAWAAAYRGPGRVRTVCCWPVLDGFVETQAAKIRALADQAPEGMALRVLFSAHGLPEKIVEAGDPYQWQVERTCAAVGRALGPEWDWRVCYQSRVGPLKWLGPSTPDALAESARDGKGVIVVPIAFVSEHVETLVELDHEYAELARVLELPVYLRAPAVSVSEAFIAALAALVRRALDRPSGVEADGGGRICPQHGRCPAQAALRALETTWETA